MKFPPFSFPKEHGTRYALVFALDAGQGSFSTAAVEYSHKNKPKILASSNGESLPSEIGSELGPKTLEELGKVIKNLSDSFPGRSLPRRQSRAVCVLGAPFYTAKTSVIKFRSKEPVLVTEALINSMVSSGVKPALNDKPLVIAKKILGVLINGYPSNSPVGKKGTAVEVHYFESVASEVLVKKISKAVEPLINSSLSFEPASLSAFISLRDEFKAPDDFLMLLPGKKITEVSLIRDSLLRSTVSFPMGTEDIQYGTKSKSKEISRSLKILKERGHESKVNLPDKTDTVISDWVKSFNASLAELEEGGPLPPVFYILDSFGADIYLSLFKAPGRYGLRLPLGVSLRLLGLKELQGTFDSGSSSFPDPAALLAALYVQHTF
ncbi:MAG: hypothetical protein AAB597_02955 [Patescibacteria group bacterium]